jgi:fructose-specific phosphotransferase system IIC component
MFDWIFDRTLRVAAGAGAALGIAMGYGQWSAHGPKGLVARGLVYWLENQSIDALIWAILGGFVAGAVVYCYRTLIKKEGEQNNAYVMLAAAVLGILPSMVLVTIIIYWHEHSAYLLNGHG